MADETKRNTTREEMKGLEEGDTFVVYGKEHVASCDAHLCGDASYDGYVVYDEYDEGWFEDDFPENAEEPNILEIFKEDIRKLAGSIIEKWEERKKEGCDILSEADIGGIIEECNRLGITITRKKGA